MAIKFVLVEIVLVETVLVGDPLYCIFSLNMNQASVVKKGERAFVNFPADNVMESKMLLRTVFYCFFKAFGIV